ncbi:hypothetical protein O6P43_020106 [Quillaja saponaria]|uniref:Uncharacterized protein n=1 Tax=Quillaja saponaria TaxID=32244 RepID=A0AAD7LJY9_QUISA|nr:hypothetical protein O6P43_020106 [Quillaja saponaria]
MLATRISSFQFGINTNSCKNGVRAFLFNPVDERLSEKLSRKVRLVLDGGDIKREGGRKLLWNRRQIKDVPVANCPEKELCLLK